MMRPRGRYYRWHSMESEIEADQAVMARPDGRGYDNKLDDY